MGMIDLDKIENPMARRIAIENMKYPSTLAFARIRFDCKAPEEEDYEDIVSTHECHTCDLLFSLRYSPITMSREMASGKRGNYKPFILKSGLILPRGVMRLKDYDDLMSSEVPAAIWIRENTNISEDVFTQARTNPYMIVPFCLDYRKYKEKTGTWAMTKFAYFKDKEGKGE